MLDELAATCGEAVLPTPLEVTDREAVFTAVARGHDRFGRLDVVLTAAGYAYFGAVEELEPHEVRTNIETNVLGTMWPIQAALPVLRAQARGHVLTVSSLGGLIGYLTGGSYGATKFAVEGLSEALAAEVAPLGIKVTIVEPGSFATGFRSATGAAPPLEAYDPVRQKLADSFKAADRGDPAATADAILAVVDAEAPLLRLALGSSVISTVHAVYRERLATWDGWRDASDAVQGGRLS